MGLIVRLRQGGINASLIGTERAAALKHQGHPPAVLTGPNLAREILAGHAAASVIGARDPLWRSRLQDVFRSGLFRVYTNHDVVGCELGGAFKNVIAIASGMGDGVGVGDNTRAAVITRGLAELTRLGVALGGEPAVTDFVFWARKKIP